MRYTFETKWYNILLGVIGSIAAIVFCIIAAIQTPFIEKRIWGIGITIIELIYLWFIILRTWNEPFSRGLLAAHSIFLGTVITFLIWSVVEWITNGLILVTMGLEIAIITTEITHVLRYLKME